MSNNQNVIEFNADGMVVEMREVSAAADDLEKKAKSLGSALNEAFAIRGIRDYRKTAQVYGKEVAGSLLSLQLRMGQLKAAIVDAAMPLANLFVPAMGRAVTAITTFLRHAGMVLGILFGGGKFTEKMAVSTGKAAKEQDKLKKSVKGTGRAIQKTLASFDEIERLGKAGGGSGGGGSLTGALEGGTWVPVHIPKEVEAFAQKVQQLLAPLQKLDFTAVGDSLDHFQIALGRLVGDVGDGLEWLWFNVLVPLSQWTVQEAAPAALNLLTQGFQTLCRVLEPVMTGFQNLMTALAPMGTFIGEVVIAILEKLREKLHSLGEVFEAKSQQITGLLTALGQIVATVWEGVQPLLTKIMELFSQVFDSVWQVGERCIGNLITVLSGFVTFISQVFAGDFAGAWETVKTTVVQILTSLGTAMWNGLKSSFDKLNGLFEQMADAIVGTFGGVKSTVKGAINGIIGFINGMISGVVSGINAMARTLNRMHFSVPGWVPVWGGRSFGFSLSQISAPQIPYLAKGAVLPANKPFLSVVGDQKHGTNIEAPLETIQTAVASVMGDLTGGMMAGFETSVGIQREILQAILGIQIGDEVIANAVSSYNRKMNVVNGGGIL